MQLLGGVNDLEGQRQGPNVFCSATGCTQYIPCYSVCSVTYAITVVVLYALPIELPLAAHSSRCLTACIQLHIQLLCALTFEVPLAAHSSHRLTAYTQLLTQLLYVLTIEVSHSSYTVQLIYSYYTDVYTGTIHTYN